MEKEREDIHVMGISSPMMFSLKKLLLSLIQIQKLNMIYIRLGFAVVPSIHFLPEPAGNATSSMIGSFLALLAAGGYTAYQVLVGLWVFCRVKWQTSLAIHLEMYILTQAIANYTLENKHFI